MFRGSASATVDDKGRLKIPAAYLDELRELGAEVFITSENPERVRIYPMKVWNGIEEKLKAGSMSHPAKQKFLTLTSAYGQGAVIDKQGRVLIHLRLRDRAQMKGEVVVLGKQTFLEVWNQARFDDHLTRNELTPEDLKALDDLGI